MTDSEARKEAIRRWKGPGIPWRTFPAAKRYKRSVRVGYDHFKTQRGPAHFVEFGRGATWEEAFEDAAKRGRLGR